MFHSLKQRGRSAFYSVGIRVAVAYSLVYAASALALGFSTWYSTTEFLEHLTEQTLYNNASILNDHYMVGGIPSIVSYVKEQMVNDINKDQIYLLVDEHGDPITGNLENWPQEVRSTKVWYRLPVRRQGINSVALLRAYTLAGGDLLLVGTDISARSPLYHTLKSAMIGATALMLLLGLLGAVAIRVLFKRVIRNISHTTRAIAGGDLSKRVQTRGAGDEFDELANGVNDMLDRILSLMDGVRGVSNSIAHDLRTPITRIRNRLEEIASIDTVDEVVRNAICRATYDLDNVTSIFNALLRISEIEAGAQRSAFSRINISSLMEDVAELYSAVAEEQNLVLKCDIAHSVFFSGDYSLIQQAAANLLDNAIKFSPRESEVILRVYVVKGTINISVLDRGPGIPEGDRKRAIERFYRGEAARNTPGSGLGLSLVNAVAQLHNGVLMLENNDPGLVATISLPENMVGNTM